MRPAARACLAVLASALALWLVLQASPAEWPGIDETVVEKVAADAGRPPRAPFLDTDRGDLLLFLFLVAGAGGGFLAGWSFRELFPPEGGGDVASA